MGNTAAITFGTHVLAVTEFQGPRVSVKLAGDTNGHAMLTPTMLRQLAAQLELEAGR